MAKALNKKLSIVIPVFNEAEILVNAVLSLTAKVQAQAWDYEILLMENGSSDETFKLALGLQKNLPNVIAIHLPQPNYGLALKTGILAAQGDLVVCDEIDLGDTEFYREALRVIETGADLVIGSKRLAQSQDQRPFIRRLGTRVINYALRILLGFKGSDTHGLKVFRRDKLLPIVNQCLVLHNLFASELVIRAERAGLAVREIPLTLREIRPPSVNLLRRVPRVLGDLVRLFYIIRIKRP